jgi:hypothetical protein
LKERSHEFRNFYVFGSNLLEKTVTGLNQWLFFKKPSGVGHGLKQGGLNQAP